MSVSCQVPPEHPDSPAATRVTGTDDVAAGHAARHRSPWGRRLCWWFGLPLALLVTLLLMLAGLVLTTPGLHLAASALTLFLAAQGQSLQLDGLEGRLYGPLQVSRIDWRSPGQRLQLREVVLDWQPGQLRQGQLLLSRVHLGHLDLTQTVDDTPLRWPENLALPLEAFGLQRVVLADFRLAQFRYRQSSADHADDPGNAPADGPPLLHDVQARVQVTPQACQLDLHHLGSGPANWHGQASLQTAAPYPLVVHLSGQSADTNAAAPTFATFAPLPGWLEKARIDLAIQGNLKALYASGQLHVEMRHSGQPPQAVTGRFAAAITPFAALPLQQLELDLPHVNPAAWLPDAPRGALALSLKMQPEMARSPAESPFAALRGQLRLQQGLMQAGQDQRLPAALPPLQLLANLHWQTAGSRKTGQHLTVSGLQLTAGQARLQGDGEIGFAGSGFRTPDFRFNGRLEAFDPARLHIRAPAGRLHADVDLQGRWSAQPAQRQLWLDYRLPPGTLLGQAIQGQGNVDWRGGHLHGLRLDMRSGPNRLQAAGSLGRTDDQLHVVLDAPHLSGLPLPAGIRGDLHLDLNLRGTLAAHRLALAVQRTAAPVLQLTAEGQGGLTADASRWQGQLRHLLLRDAGDKPLLQLDTPIPLFFSPGEFRLDAPARFLGGVNGAAGQLLLQRLHYRQGGDWQSQGRLVQWQVEPWLNLSASSGRVVKLPANSPPLDLDWNIAAGRTLHGEIGLQVPDLAWLGPLLGPDWKSAGTLQARLQLGGTPRAPRLQGRIDGEKLGLLALDSRLQLEQGQLHAEWQGDTLTLKQLVFDSRLQPAPRPLRALVDSPSLLQTAVPGKFTASGAFRLTRTAAGRPDVQGGLDMQMQRLGVFQQGQQWLLLSGNGRLQGLGQRLLLSGKVQADAAWFELPPASRPRLSEDVVIRGRMPAARSGEDNALPLDLALSLDLGRAFHFRGGGLNSRLAGQLDLRGPNLHLPRATGVIRTVEGSFDAYGRTLALARGILNFQGDPENPGLNIRAVRQQLPVVAGIEVGGTVQAPRVQLVSTPEVPDAEKLSWLILGMGTSGSDAGSVAGGLNDQDKRLLMAAASGLFSQMTGGAEGGILRQLQDALGVDVVMADGNGATGRSLSSGSRIANAYGFSSDAGGSASGQMVSLSKRLSGNLLLAYEQVLGSTASVIRLTLGLGRRFALVGRAGTDNALDLLYEFSFGQ